MSDLLGGDHEGARRVRRDRHVGIAPAHATESLGHLVLDGPHQLAVEGRADLQADCFLSTLLDRELDETGDAGLLARADDLARRVEVRGRDDASLGRLFAELFDGVGRESDDRRHRPRPLRLDLRHQAAAKGHDLHAVLHRERTRDHGGRVLAEAVTGDEVRGQAELARCVGH